MQQKDWTTRIGRPIYQITIQTKTEIGDRIGQRTVGNSSTTLLVDDKTEAIQKKCQSCILCKISGKNIRANMSKTETNYLPRLDSLNEEIQLGFIGPITENNSQFYIFLSIDRFSKWPAASFCTSLDGEKAVNFREQYIRLSGVPKTTRTDQATAFTGRLFRDFCKKH